MRGRDQIDLSVDPPPDLAVEVDISSSSINRMQIYAALGVPELWRHDGESLQFYKLNSEGEYEAIQQSEAIRGISCDELTEYLLQRNEMDETCWVKEFRRQVRGRRH